MAESVERRAALRARLHEIVFEADTPSGRRFDIALFLAIIASIGVVMLDSVAPVSSMYGAWLRGLEWGFTAIFTIEYGVRLWSVKKPLLYARSFYGAVDLLALLPTYLSLLLPGGQYLLVVRALRLLRVFRVLKLSRYVGESAVLVAALRASRRKITVFLLFVVTMAVIFGTLMYLVEGPSAGFVSIPVATYWAIVTLTTVGYGDIAPVTLFGRMMASMLMVLGFGVIAVPTGILSAEMMQASSRRATTQACPACGADALGSDSKFCHRCGAAL